ncbi:type IX secretion system plug protein [Flavobacterium oreochromis]|uniref:DUF5103 domain-containing protein n=2 Tax=Flavobacterium TaxID=237 RepID=A0A2D0AHY4_9FLAO|nr:DUF5103 domain-containing protein [Flavobacterium oreochromis]OWP75376.1 DUF5103 domain-containing protein [Flavobacterium oreochromis]OWP77709.1 DUF5103 domain-containing protein [Flavobacterium oreochromis]POR24880.1 DUF5103 domain-containing protein [Flavobacterium columnare]QYS87592.1 DUF5103 domain-containing protein [Flavobacterium oreochromis]
MKSTYIVILFLFSHFTWSQLNENIPPFNIKTIAFKQANNVVFPFFKLGETFEFSFDDLYGNEEDYYFTITHCNYDWTVSDLTRNEYLNGNDNQRIQDYQNSFNTLQGYSHYRLNFPNNFCQIIKTGNYVLSIFNKNKELIFLKKFMIYEDQIEVPVQIKRSRNLSDINEKQNVELAVKSKNILFQNPLQNVKIAIFQNGRWDTAKYNIKPQYTIGNDLIYRYNTETQFWAGNEYYYYDNKDIKIPTNSIARVDSSSGLYNTLLYPNEARKNKGYTFFPDVDGIFQNRNVFARDNNDVETDYSWVYFSLFAPNYPKESAIYVTGLFNNYLRTDENKMDYNANKGMYEKAIMIKQGFINYNYTLVNSKNQIDYQNAIDGNYYQTENKYQVFVYYRANGERFDRIIGMGEASSLNITN